MVGIADAGGEACSASCKYSTCRFSSCPLKAIAITRKVEVASAEKKPIPIKVYPKNEAETFKNPMETIKMKPYTISCTSCPSKKVGLAGGEDGPYDPSCRFSCCVLKESLTCRSRTCRSRMEEPPCPCLLRGASSCPLREGQAYSRALVSLRGRPGPSMLREMVGAKARLHQAMCRSPNDDDEVDEESPEEMQEELQEEMHEMREKTVKIAPKGFPYHFYLMGDEKDFDEPIFPTYRGPVYWNDLKREGKIDPYRMMGSLNRPQVVHSLPPVRVSGGRQPLTPRTLCEEVNKVQYDPLDYSFLEDVKIEFRHIQGREAMTIVFVCGS